MFNMLIYKNIYRYLWNACDKCLTKNEYNCNSIIFRRYNISSISSSIIISNNWSIFIIIYNSIIYNDIKIKSPHKNNKIGQPVQIIFDKHLDYSNENIFNRINSLVIELRKDECFESEIYLTSSWIHSFRFYLENNYGNINDINSTLFYEILYLEYLTTEEGESYIDDIWNTIVIDNDNDNNNIIFNRDTIGLYAYKYINRSRISMNLVPRGGFSTEPIADCLSNFKPKIMSNYKDDLNTYYYLYVTVIAESDLVTISQTIRNLIYAMIAACIITIILIPYPLMTIFVMTTVGQILFGAIQKQSAVKCISVYF